MRIVERWNKAELLGEGDGLRQYQPVIGRDRCADQVLIRTRGRVKEVLLLILRSHFQIDLLLGPLDRRPAHAGAVNLLQLQGL